NEDEPAVTPAAARQAAPSRPAPRPATSPAADGVDERLTQVAARAGAVRASLNNLKQSQAQGGLGLRRDMATAENTMGFNLQQAEEKLAAGDSAGAKRNLDLAEKALEKLERFLGF